MVEYELLNNKGYLLLRNKHLFQDRYSNTIQLSTLGGQFDKYKDRFNKAYDHYGQYIYYANIYNIFFHSGQVQYNNFWNNKVSWLLQKLSNNKVYYDNKPVNVKYILTQTNRIYSKHAIFRTKIEKNKLSDDAIQLDFNSFTPWIISKYLIGYNIEQTFYSDIRHKLIHLYGYKQVSISDIKKLIMLQIFSDNLINRFQGIQFIDELYKLKCKLYMIANKYHITTNGLKIDISDKKSNIIAKVIHAYQTQIVTQILINVINQIGIQNFYFLIYDNLIFNVNCYDVVKQIINNKFNLGYSKK